MKQEINQGPFHLQMSIRQWVIILFPICMLGPLGMDLYLPAIPAMSEALRTPSANIQLTLSFYVAAFGFGQLLFGPLSDSIGRRKVLIFGPIIFGITSFLCMLSNHFLLFLVFRFIQGLAASASGVVVFAIVRDLFSGATAAQTISFISGGISLVPVCAPILGSYLLQFFGWKGNFSFFILFALIVLGLSFFRVPETLSVENKRAFAPKEVLKNFGPLFKHKIFMIYALVGALSFGALLLFFSLSTEIFIEKLHYSSQKFSLIFAFNALILMIGNWSTGVIVKSWGIFKTVFVGCLLICIGGIILLLLTYVYSPEIFTVSIPMGLASLGITFCMGPTMSAAITHFAKMAGQASALCGAIRFLVSSFIVAILTTLPLPPHLVLGSSLAIFGLVSILLLLGAHLEKSIEENKWKVEVTL